MSLIDRDFPNSLGIGTFLVEASLFLVLDYNKFQSGNSKLLSQQVIEHLKITREVRRYPNIFLSMCSPTSVNSCTVSDKNHWEKVKQRSSDSYLLVFIISCIFSTSKLYFAAGKFVFVKVAGLVHFCIRWLYFLLWRVPMGCFSWVQERWQRIIVWFSKKFGKGYERIPGDDTENVRKFSREIRSLRKTLDQKEPISNNIFESEGESSSTYNEKQERDLEEFKQFLNTSINSRKDDSSIRSHESLMSEIRELKQSLSKSSRDSSAVGCPIDSQQEKEENDAFEKERERQQREFEEKMEQLKKQREDMQRKHEEELQAMKQESAERVLTFLKCVELKLRFKENEEEWGRMLDSLKRPLVNAVNSFHPVESELKLIAKEDKPDVDNLKFFGNFFAKRVAHAQKLLANAFDNLEYLSNEYSEKIFIKMIMKSVSKCGNECDTIGKTLVEVMNNPVDTKLHKDLKSAVARLSPHSIPTTSSLLHNSPSAREEDYLSIDRVDYPDNWAGNFTQ